MVISLKSSPKKFSMSSKFASNVIVSGYAIKFFGISIKFFNVSSPIICSFVYIISEVLLSIKLPSIIIISLFKFNLLFLIFSFIFSFRE